MDRFFNFEYDEMNENIYSPIFVGMLSSFRFTKE